MRIVAIHGIGNEYEGPEGLRASWLPAIQDGLVAAGYPKINCDEFTCAFYGNIFRPSGMRGSGSSMRASKPPEGEQLEWEVELLEKWWHKAAQQETTIQPPDLVGKGVARGLTMILKQSISITQLLKHSCFKGFGEQTLRVFLNQVYQYLNNSQVKQQVQKAVLKSISSETEILIGHSLGSIVAYEILCAHTDWHINTLITLGSPLGIRPFIFDNLDPHPTNGQGHFPPVKRWFNIADRADIVASENKLSDLFGSQTKDGQEIIENLSVHNKRKHFLFHDAKYYLNSEQVGTSIASGLGWCEN